MTTPKPQVSVLLPVHNGLPYLEEAVESILGQSFTDFEVVALDDRSTDGSGSFLRNIEDPRIRVVPGASPGLVSVLNQGISEARGAYLARMDSDDICCPSRLEQQVAFLDQNPLVGIVCSDVEIVDSLGRRRRSDRVENLTESKMRASILEGHSAAIIHPSTMIRKSTMLRLGGYRHYDVAEDRDLWLRASDICQIRRIPKSLLQYRVHSKGVSRERVLTQYRSQVRLEVNYLIKETSGIDLYKDRPALDALLKTSIDEILSDQSLRRRALHRQTADAVFNRQFGSALLSGGRYLAAAAVALMINQSQADHADMTAKITEGLSAPPPQCGWRLASLREVVRSAQSAATDQL